MTSGLSFMGSYSGITMDTIDQLIQAESGKLVQYSNQQKGLTNEKNAWKDINTRLDSLYKNFEALKESKTFDSKTVSNSNEKNLTVTAGTNALEGSYSVEVKKLATSSQVTSDTIEMAGKKVSSSDKLTLEGNITLTDTDNLAISIEVKNGDSLKDIVTKINDFAKEKESGLRASIVDSRIVLTDSVGEQQIGISGTDKLISDLGMDTSSRTEIVGGKSEISVNGITITGNTNTIENAVEGLTFNLLALSEGNLASTVKVVEDQDKTTKAVQDFVDQYNSTMTFIDEQLSVGDPSAEGNTTGTLVGDSSLMRIQSQLRSLMTTSSKETTQSIKGLSDLGIEVDRYGKASLDTTKLKEQLTKNSNSVQNFFSREESIVVKDAVGNETTETKQFGFAQQMTSFINEYIADKTGIITTKSKTIDDMIKSLDTQITKFNERLDSKRERYIKQFTALDTAMMQAESQLSYLMSQIGTTNQQA
ncbi:flagellar filament capping protein FliD [Desemzia incerta]|uniref:flagellar filament capping protein FliD n=1 Tax=Desemzia incerta TaxID=82801 RepID=UPI003D0096B1